MFRNKSKKQWGKIASAFVLATVITGSMFNNAPTAEELTNPFTDVSTNNSHYNAIVTLYNDDIVTGITATEFKPNQEATRGDAALYLANALQLDTQNVQNPGFKDVPSSSKYYGAIAALFENNIISGYGDTFKPNNTLTRSQMAKMLTLGFDLDIATTTNSKFVDVNKLTDTNTKRYIQTLVDYQITVGTTETTFSPNGKLKRGQLASFLFNAIEATEPALEIISVE